MGSDPLVIKLYSIPLHRQLLEKYFTSLTAPVEIDKAGVDVSEPLFTDPIDGNSYKL